MNNYWIESLREVNKADKLFEATISRTDHKECIVVYGDSDECTQRTIAIISALNKVEVL